MSGKAGITFTNFKEVMMGMQKRIDRIEGTLEKAGKQMGILAENEIHPLTNKKSHNWDNSIKSRVQKIGPFKFELWVGSKGAFNGKGYNYGARQERLFHPIETGWHRSMPARLDTFQRLVTAGLAGRSVSQNISSGSVDEFASMAGF